MANVVLLNSGGSNYTSLLAAFRRLGANCELSTDPERILRASHVVLPGVGSAASAMQAIQSQNLAPVITALQQPLLGICLGMQILFDASEESGIDCLGLIPGRVCQLPVSEGIRVPHMGWNRVQNKKAHPLLKNLDDRDFYFVHSYAVAEGEFSIGLCSHGQTFTAAVACNNRMGVQFHPERSGEQGQQLLANFLEMAE